jgi:hypothetical protein
VETRQILRSGITASALAHLSLLALVIFFAEVHPFGAVTAETIAVDIVAAEEVAEKASDLPPTSKSEASDSFDLSSSGVRTSASSAAAPSPAGSQPGASPAQTTPPPQQQQAALSQPGAAPAPQQGPDASSATSPLATDPAPDPVSDPAPSSALSSVSSSASLAAPAPATGRQVSAAPPAQSPTPVPAYVPASPDLSIKYGVVLGLPLDLPQDKHRDTYDAPAIENADLESSPIAEFRRHIKTCSTLPKEVGASDKVAIKLRVMMRPDGRLAADPQLIEGTASAKGASLMHSAISALQSCQPYAMLPADKYNEWKVLDLSFTPQDFGGAS